MSVICNKLLTLKNDLLNDNSMVSLIIDYVRYRLFCNYTEWSTLPTRTISSTKHRYPCWQTSLRIMRVYVIENKSELILGVMWRRIGTEPWLKCQRRFIASVWDMLACLAAINSCGNIRCYLQIVRKQVGKCRGNYWLVQLSFAIIVVC